MSIDQREVARQLIEEHLKDTDGLTADIDAAISEAMVTVVFPGDEVCPSCGGTGQPSESDGTPKDLPQWEDLRALLEQHRDSPLTDGELADKVMRLFGGES